MTENKSTALGNKFDELVEKLKGKIIIRITETRQELATINVFTSLPIDQSNLVMKKKVDHIAWLQYECNMFEANERVQRRHRFVISFLSKEDCEPKRVHKSLFNLIEKSDSDISTTFTDIDGEEKTTHSSLALFYFIHLARLQGMIVAECQFYTSRDRIPELTVADRIGGILKKKLLEIHGALEAVKKL